MKFRDFAEKMVSILAILVLSLLTVFNLLYIVKVTNFSENVIINSTLFFRFIVIIALDIIILYFFQLIQILKKINYNVFIIAGIVIYFLISVVWINRVNIEPIDDSKSVNDLAIKFVLGDKEGIRNNGYLEKYPSQIGVVLIISVIYNKFGTTNYKIIQYINIVSNIITILVMFAILNKMSKKYSFNKFIYFFITLTFIPLILLSTYVYGDYIGLTMCIIGIYFIIDYKEDNKLYKCVLSACFMSLAYITKMNYLIPIIAISIYLMLYIIQEKNKLRIIQSTLILALFIIISLLPFSIIKLILTNHYQYEKQQALPTNVWLCIGMNESYRANGWYSDIAGDAWKDTPNAKSVYNDKIKDRLKFFIKNPIYTIKFYALKTISGWCDPYFQSIWYNVGVEKKDENIQRIFNRKIVKMVEIYEKSVVGLIYGGALFAVIKNKNKLNNEFILFITIFIGGVLFHTIWEMKSRYTMPYVIMIIPISCIGIQEILNILKVKRIEEIK